MARAGDRRFYPKTPKCGNQNRRPSRNLYPSPIRWPGSSLGSEIRPTPRHRRRKPLPPRQGESLLQVTEGDRAVTSCQMPATSPSPNLSPSLTVSPPPPPQGEEAPKATEGDRAVTSCQLPATNPSPNHLSIRSRSGSAIFYRFRTGLYGASSGAWSKRRIKRWKTSVWSTGGSRMRALCAVRYPTLSPSSLEKAWLQASPPPPR